MTGPANVNDENHRAQTVLPALAVVIPARNERERLPRCLAALCAADHALRQQMSLAPPTRVVVVLDRCSDGSRAVVDQWPGVEALTRDYGNVGAARAAGADHAMTSDATAVPDWIASTDADSAVPVDWLVHQMMHAMADTDLLLGLVQPDPHELQPSGMARWRSRYHLKDGHSHVHGANMGIRTAMYRRAGGFPPVAEHEDVVLAGHIGRLGGRVVSTARSPVLTSGRTDGRTPGGVAGYLRSIAP